MGALTLVLGGQKAGKSSAAMHLATATGQPVRLITPARGDDPELAERIARHRADRPADVAVDETFDVADALGRVPDDAAIIDALDTWLLDRMEGVGLLDVGSEPTPLGESGQKAQRDVLAEVDAIATAAEQRRGATFVVAGTVGMGLHGDTPIARRYEDLHGLATQRLGSRAWRVLLVVAGRAIDLAELDVLKEPRP